MEIHDFIPTDADLSKLDGIMRGELKDSPFLEGQKRIVVRSRTEAKSFVSDVCWAGIQVATHAGDWPVLNETKRMGLLQLNFLDLHQYVDGIERSDAWQHGSRLFCENKADLVLDFVEKMWDKVDLFLVHCEAGISRSPGIAAAICKIKYGHDEHFFKHYLPNRLVYKTIVDRALCRSGLSL